MMKKFNLRKCKGIGLVELLVALLLSSLVAVAVVQIFGQNRTSNIAHEDVTRLQENGRYAIQLLNRELRSSDFWGCNESFEGIPNIGNTNTFPNTGVINNVVGLNLPDPALNPSVNGVGISGQDGMAAPGPDGFPNRPDTLQVTGLRTTQAFPLADPHAADSTAFTVNVNGLTGITPNEILVASNCVRAVLFQVTNNVDAGLNPNGVNQEATIVHSATPNPGFPTPFSNADDELANSEFNPVSTSIYRNFAVSRTFSIANDDPDNNPATPAVPTLMLSIDGGAPQPLVPGVENMQVVYGEDLNGDDEADRFVTQAQNPDFRNVVSVRVSLLVRAPDANNPFASPYTMEGNTVIPQAAPNGLFHSRRVYTTTIALRNRTT